MSENTSHANTMNYNELYKEETFTDRKIGSIRRYTPVDALGNADSSRNVIYVGEAQVYTPGGALPLSFELKVESLQEAAAQFADAAQISMKETIEQIREMQRQEASSIVIPGQDPRGNLMGGKIRIP